MMSVVLVSGGVVRTQSMSVVLVSGGVVRTQ